MGIAAYNRGSTAISRQIDEELQRSPTKGLGIAMSVDHPKQEDFKQPEISRSYIDITEDSPIQVGERVFCTVTAIRGWMTVTAVKGARSGLRIKTDGFSGWGYGHNFTRKPPDWMIRK